MPEDELEKLRSTLTHAYDKRQPLTRRFIQAVKERVGARTRKKASEQGREVEKNKDAA